MKTPILTRSQDIVDPLGVNVLVNSPENMADLFENTWFSFFDSDIGANKMNTLIQLHDLGCDSNVRVVMRTLRKKLILDDSSPERTFHSMQSILNDLGVPGIYQIYPTYMKPFVEEHIENKNKIADQHRREALEEKRLQDEEKTRRYMQEAARWNAQMAHNTAIRDANVKKAVDILARNLSPAQLRMIIAIYGLDCAGPNPMLIVRELYAKSILSDSGLMEKLNSVIAAVK